MVPAIPEFDFASTTALRETGIVLPQVWGVSHVTPNLVNEASEAPRSGPHLAMRLRGSGTPCPQCI